MYVCMYVQCAEYYYINTSIERVQAQQCLALQLISSGNKILTANLSAIQPEHSNTVMTL
jgi:hypothetical protein